MSTPSSARVIGLAKLKQAADRPACGGAGAHELRAHQNGDAEQRHRIGPVDRRDVRQSAFSFRNSRSGRGYTNAARGASVTGLAATLAALPPRLVGFHVKGGDAQQRKRRPASRRGAADRRGSGRLRPACRLRYRAASRLSAANPRRLAPSAPAQALVRGAESPAAAAIEAHSLRSPSARSAAPAAT